jgi:RNA polymerase sigma-70 factor, ECF subfamily
VAELSELAFGEFYRATSRSLWTYVYRATASAADADDIVQEAFCRLLRADVGGLSDEDLRRYLFRTAGNLVADRWRRESRHRSWLQRERPDVSQAPAERDDAVARTFRMLKARDRALLWLAYVEEQGHGEIAGALKVGQGSVKVLLSRARGRLRDLLKTQFRPATEPVVDARNK